MPIASLPIEFIRKQITQGAANASLADEITLPTSLRANGGYAVFLYAVEVEIEGTVDYIADADGWEFCLTKTDPSNTIKHLNDSDVISKMAFEFNITTEGSDVTPKVYKDTFIRPVILAGEKIYGCVNSTGLAAALSFNIRLHYQLKWVNAQVFNRSLLTNV
jgi:hypothetical protein